MILHYSYFQIKIKMILKTFFKLPNNIKQCKRPKKKKRWVNEDVKMNLVH